MTDFSTNPFEDDKLREECGVYGIIGSPDASASTVLGLHALQHRGQEAAGVVTYDGSHFHQHVAFGKVGESLNSPEVIDNLPGDMAIGHNRYSTSGSKRSINNIQPLFAEMDFGGIALAHNGNLTNALTLRKELVSKGSIFRTTMDTEVVIHLIATSTKDSVLDAVVDALRHVQGAYSMVVLTKDTLIGVRDPYGVRPLVLGKLGDAYILASESCALDIINAEFVRDVEPGEVLIINRDRMQSIFPFTQVKQRFCVFEYVYFSRPDSRAEGRYVYETRRRMGQELARESHVPADVVIPVPDSGVPAAIGFAEQAAIPFELGIIRNHYVGRTFIEPADQVRHFGVRLKHNANRGIMEGKRIILLDDSIVRGTTSKKIVAIARDAGAKEVHMRISSPPTSDSCYYGVDTPEKSELLASKMSIEEMADFIGVDSLSFLSIDGMYRAVQGVERNDKEPQYCDACFTSDYPIALADKTRNSLPLLEPLLIEAAKK